MNQKRLISCTGCLSLSITLMGLLWTPGALAADELTRLSAALDETVLGAKNDIAIQMDSTAPAVSLNKAVAIPAATSWNARIKVRPSDDDQQAGLVIDGKEVLRIRSGLAGLSAFKRVDIIRDRLQTFLQEGGQARDIKPGLAPEAGANGAVIRAGKTILVTIDASTAQKAQSQPKSLALQWANLMRQALGAPPLVHDSEKVASRNFSPALVMMRQDLKASSLNQGIASWYGPGFHNRRTSSGERFNMFDLTAAHRSLPFNTKLKVTNLRNGKSVVVRVTDRGPFSGHRIIDLSKGAAQAIGMLSSGTAPVSLEVMAPTH